MLNKYVRLSKCDWAFKTNKRLKLAFQTLRSSLSYEMKVVIGVHFIHRYMAVQREFWERFSQKFTKNWIRPFLSFNESSRANERSTRFILYEASMNLYHFLIFFLFFLLKILLKNYDKSIMKKKIKKKTRNITLYLYGCIRRFFLLRAVH